MGQGRGPCEVCLGLLILPPPSKERDDFPPPTAKGYPRQPPGEGASQLAPKSKGRLFLNLVN